jgi:hypothetical protein
MNHPILKDTGNVDYYAHTQGAETILRWNGILTHENIQVLFVNAVRKGKASEREPRHRSQTPQSRHDTKS